MAANEGVIGHSGVPGVDTLSVWAGCFQCDGIGVHRIAGDFVIAGDHRAKYRIALVELVACQFIIGDARFTH